MFFTNVFLFHTCTTRTRNYYYYNNVPSIVITALLGWKLDVFAIAVLASDGHHVLAARFFHGEYAISHGSESISLHNDDDVDGVRCRDEVATSEKRCLI